MLKQNGTTGKARNISRLFLNFYVMIVVELYW